VGEDQWWIRGDEGGAKMNEERSAPSEGTPEVLTPLPQSYRKLTQPRSVLAPIGENFTQHVLEPGEYVLGPVQATSTGDGYDVMRRVADDKWELVVNLPESVTEQQLFKKQ